MATLAKQVPSEGLSSIYVVELNTVTPELFDLIKDKCARSKVRKDGTPYNYLTDTQFVFSTQFEFAETLRLDVAVSKAGNKCIGYTPIYSIEEKRDLILRNREKYANAKAEAPTLPTPTEVVKKVTPEDTEL
jgi:hypothetical protein